MFESSWVYCKKTRESDEVRLFYTKPRYTTVTPRERIWGVTVKKNSAVKPTKPYPDFPLFPHASGKWAIKTKGKFRYFGTWDDPDSALKEYLAFLKPATKTFMSLEDACNLFMKAKRDSRDSGKIAARTYRDYLRTLKHFADFVGRTRNIDSIGPPDFSRYASDFASRNNIVSTGNEITRVRSMFKWLVSSEYLKDFNPGPDFRRPSAKAVRKYRREVGKKLYSAEEIRSIINESGFRMKAMILLGINCGYHNIDCELLPLSTARSATESGVIFLERSKTEIDRECPLWPETIRAIKDYLKTRPECDSNLAFVLPNKQPLSSINNDVAKRFRSVRDAAGIRRGGFSWLRKTFATEAGATGDQVAVNAIMGHVDDSIPAIYRQEIQKDRLARVVEHVRAWLGISACP